MKKSLTIIQRMGQKFVMVLTALMLALTLFPSAFADVDERTPRLTQQPDQLVLQLGTRWAGVQFELRTDAGIFPAPVVVDESGVLTMDLGGSTTYTLSCLNSEVPIPAPSDDPAPDVSEGQPSPEVTEQLQQPALAPTQSQNTPVFPIVIFLAGLVLAAGGGAALYLAKRSQQADYDDWEDEEDEL